MSGITAILAPPQALSADQLRRATDRLRHRGPDGQAEWISSRGDVGLGQTLLGHQLAGPDFEVARNEDGRIRGVLSGSFFGLGDLRRELEERGHQFAGHHDVEIAIHLYEEIGSQCLHQLRGEFAFILWDEAQRLLFAARDRFGAKPLVYARQGEALYLASEAKALFAAGVEAGWDEEAVFQQLFVCLEEDRSLFRGVFQLPPGHYLLASRHHFQIYKYWDLDYPPTAQLPAVDEEELLAELRQRLDEAVRIRLDSAGGVGFFLSGGVDSSTVLALGARHAPAPIRAFTVTFEEDGYDEAAAARSSAEHVGAVFEPFLVTEQDLADNLKEAVLAGEMLGLNAHGVARYLHCRALRQAGYKALLSGEGSDDIFAGYPPSKLDMMQAGAGGQGRPRMLAGVHRVLGFVPAWMQKVALTRSVFHALLAPEIRQEFGDRDPYRVFLDRCDVEGQLAGREPVIQGLYLWSKAFLAGYALCAGRLAMACSVEERLPFMDHHLFDLVRRIPASLLIRDHKEKYILRQAARPWLAPATYNRAKHSFSAPPTVGDRHSPLDQLLQDTLRGGALAAVPLFDRASVVALLDQLPQMNRSTRVALDPVLLMIACMCLLQEGYGL